MAEIIRSYSPLQRVYAAEDVGEYAVIRTREEQNHRFLIYFVKDPDGMWKLEAM